MKSLIKYYHRWISFNGTCPCEWCKGSHKTGIASMKFVKELKGWGIFYHWFYSTLYIFPIPHVGVKIEFKRKYKNSTRSDRAGK